MYGYNELIIVFLRQAGFIMLKESEFIDVKIFPNVIVLRMFETDSHPKFLKFTQTFTHRPNDVGAS